MKKFLSVLTIPLTALAVLTGAIALPLLVRPFYWAQIQALDIPARSGLTVEQLRDAFGDVMDYCLGLRPDFAAGVLPFSAEGASHFADVRVLFILNLAFLALSVAVLSSLRGPACGKKQSSPVWPDGPRASGPPAPWAASY